MTRIKKAAAAILGFVAGIANGLFGGGGGALVVPTLRQLLDTEEKRAHATAIAVMLPVSVLSATAYLLRGIGDVVLTLEVGGGAVLGGALGALCLGKIPKGFLSLLFYGVMIYVGVRFVIA